MSVVTEIYILRAFSDSITYSMSQHQVSTSNDRLCNTKNNKQKRMKHGKQRAIGKIAFKNQQNSLLKPLVIPDWLVSGAKATCASCILFPSRFSHLSV